MIVQITQHRSNAAWSVEGVAPVWDANALALMVCLRVRSVSEGHQVYGDKVEAAFSFRFSPAGIGITHTLTTDRYPPKPQDAVPMRIFFSAHMQYVPIFRNPTNTTLSLEEA